MFLPKSHGHLVRTQGSMGVIEYKKLFKEILAAFSKNEQNNELYETF